MSESESASEPEPEPEPEPASESASEAELDLEADLEPEPGRVPERTSETNASAMRWSDRVSPSDATCLALASSVLRTST